MNVTELARRLKLTPQELRDALPQLGFDIGQKAIKINVQVANKVIREWPELKRKLENLRREEEKDAKTEEASAPAAARTVKIPQLVTVKELAGISGIPLNAWLSEFMKNGVYASLNEPVDFETAWLVGSELGLKIKLDQNRDEDHQTSGKDRLKQVIADEDQDRLEYRPPVIVVMGHVDHGKTKLLDAIRKTNVVDDEAGGITQHIGAYQVKRNDKLITFVDTPGHEAFTAMRSRGARVADIAILVVAADDGVKPQTVEAYRIIEAAKLPFLVAINKIDKDEANIDKTKQELSTQLAITPEEWGGRTIMAPISAKAGTGIQELLDSILLVAEMESGHMKANPEASAIGTVIESNLDKGAGPVATILVQNGTLRVGDELVLDNQFYGKVRSLEDYRGEKIEKAVPSTPVKIIGLKAAPKVGDILAVGKGEKTRMKKFKRSERIGAGPGAADEDAEGTVKLNLIIKADVLGSAEAIEESLEKIDTKKVKLHIIHKGLGNISDGDIKRAEATGGTIIGFNVSVPTALEEAIREKNIEVKLYRIIYDLIQEVKNEINELTDPDIRRVDLGEGQVLAIFRTEKDSQIIGLKVASGKIERDAKIEVVRGGELTASGELVRLQSGKQDVSAAEAGEECGLQFKGKPVIQVGDTLKFYKEESVITKV